MVPHSPKWRILAPPTTTNSKQILWNKFDLEIVHLICANYLAALIWYSSCEGSHSHRVFMNSIGMPFTEETISLCSSFSLRDSFLLVFCHVHWALMLWLLYVSHLEMRTQFFILSTFAVMNFFIDYCLYQKKFSDHWWEHPRSKDKNTNMYKTISMDI